MNIADIIIEKIINRVATEGKLPWSKAFHPKGTVKYFSGESYKGTNLLLLPPGEYAGFNSIKNAGGHLNKGSKSFIVIFYSKVPKKDNGFPVIDKNGNQLYYNLLKYENTFSISDTNLSSKMKSFEWENDETAFEYENQLLFTEARESNPAYIPELDCIRLPRICQYPKKEDFYKSKFHELIHSTGVESRLNRYNSSLFSSSEERSVEELTAEFGAAILLGIKKINWSEDRSVSYIQRWIEVLNNDKSMLLKAASQAQKAVDYILSFENDNEEIESDEIE